MVSWASFSAFWAKCMFFSYKNMLFYMGSRFTAYSHILFKNFKIKHQKTCFGPYGRNVSFLLHKLVIVRAMWFWDLLAPYS